MRLSSWLAAFPILGILVGVFFANRTHPFVLGMPFLMFWIVLWVVMTTVIMFVVYKLDPSNHGGDSK